MIQLSPFSSTNVTFLAFFCSTWRDGLSQYGLSKIWTSF
jgi:hypothetical protein